jgi:hypothetical protein
MMADDIYSSQPHDSPDSPRPDGTVPDPTRTVPATGTMGARVTLVAQGAGITTSAPFVPTVFRTPCERCGHQMAFPFNAKLSALLDWLAVLVDDPQPTDEGR